MKQCHTLNVVDNTSQTGLILGVRFSPAITVGRVNVDSKLHQELDNFSVACTHRVVEGSDSLIIGQAGVIHLNTHTHTQTHTHADTHILIMYLSSTPK